MLKSNFCLRFRAIVDDDDVIEEHSSVGQLKATNEECTTVTLEECFQVASLKNLKLRFQILTLAGFVAIHASRATGS